MTCPLYRCENNRHYCNKTGNITPGKALEECLGNYELCLLNTREEITDRTPEKAKADNPLPALSIPVHSHNNSPFRPQETRTNQNSPESY